MCLTKPTVPAHLTVTSARSTPLTTGRPGGKVKGVSGGPVGGWAIWEPYAGRRGTSSESISLAQKRKAGRGNPCFGTPPP